MYLIEILHQTTTAAISFGSSVLLYLIEILHQTTTTPVASGDFSSCILSKFYIKPQHFDFEKRINYVVSYRNSTSNHNFIDALSARARLYLIEILHQTTTCVRVVIERRRLYLIEILHQTTTIRAKPRRLTWLYLIEILHQTTTLLSLPLPGALLYLIEILHQTTTRPLLMFLLLPLYLIEILHQTTTMHYSPMFLRELYLIEILHQTTTSKSITGSLSSCILSKFYIKPQPGYYLADIRKVVSYRNSTSNHNRIVCTKIEIQLYLIEILHQTTTNRPHVKRFRRCILSKFYIKPQLGLRSIKPPICCILSKFYIKPQQSLILAKSTQSCILSKFYIKPQLFVFQCLIGCVVSYRNSTSNHNRARTGADGESVVSYRNSTSNHNRNNR